MTSVLAIHRYYWPDTPPYASMLRSIVREWTDAGISAEVLSSQPSYKPETARERRPALEVIDGARVRRLAMRPDRSSRVQALFNVAYFPVAAALRVLLGRRRDVVMCSTAPPVLLGWTVSWASVLRRSRFVYHCMDPHPEIGRLSGDFTNPLVYRLLARLELATCRRAAAIVVLSDDMRQAVEARDPALRDRVVVLTNFELPDHDAPAGPVASPLPADPAKVRLVFAGNIGRFQGLETLVAGVLGAGPELDGLQMVFMGEGGAKTGLQQMVDDAGDAARRVVFLPHGTPAEARALLSTADLGLVSLTPEVIRYAYPSKTATYLACGLPVLVAVEEDSALARMIVERGVGGLLPVSDQESVRRALARWVADPAALKIASANALAVWQKEYAAEELLPRWAELLSRVAAGAQGGAVV